jgi:hypothetical protein
MVNRADAALWKCDFSGFGHNLRSVMEHGIIHVHPKVDLVVCRRKFRFAVFKSGNMLLVKYSRLNVLPLGRTLNVINFCGVKNTVIIVFRANCLLRPQNHICRRMGKHFRGCRGMLTPGLVACGDAVKIIYF